jgi:hypothetical protein
VGFEGEERVVEDHCVETSGPMCESCRRCPKEFAGKKGRAEGTERGIYG